MASSLRDMFDPNAILRQRQLEYERGREGRQMNFANQQNMIQGGLGTLQSALGFIGKQQDRASKEAESAKRLALDERRQSSTEDYRNSMLDQSKLANNQSIIQAAAEQARAKEKEAQTGRDMSFGTEVQQAYSLGGDPFQFEPGPYAGPVQRTQAAAQGRGVSPAGAAQAASGALTAQTGQMEDRAKVEAGALEQKRALARIAAGKAGSGTPKPRRSGDIVKAVKDLVPTPELDSLAPPEEQAKAKAQAATSAATVEVGLRINARGGREGSPAELAFFSKEIVDTALLVTQALGRTNEEPMIIQDLAELASQPGMENMSAQEIGDVYMQQHPKGTDDNKTPDPPATKTPQQLRQEENRAKMSNTPLARFITGAGEDRGERNITGLDNPYLGSFGR